MKNKILNINSVVNDGHCLNDEVMIDLVKDNLDLYEKTVAENHIKACELCREAFEGAKMFYAHEQEADKLLQETLEELDITVNKTVKKHKVRKVRQQITWLAAASVLVLLGLSMVFSLYIKEPNREKLYASYYNTYPDYISSGEYRGNASEVTTLDEAMMAYNESKYAQAIIDLEEVLINQPGNEDIRFYLGISHMETKDFAKAILYFKSILIKGTSSFSQPAEWYLALALMHKGDLDACKKELQQVINRNNSYSDKAQELLKQL